ncbi:4Fe-4S ferredoxin iron-sulfur binding domain protein [Desulfatibacillum aliphaticivorans]|uniref:4Fe-4S ferredoxin iron-sulfur binding domain protein n=1 Tax=Desulfatibacillum aliphaticivorans TaxID=218208 RepID=B8FH06_DESAL|nr:4Fe-4S dicluster domain-containing protein [Desulfatibacillum aliphaticivorans]ACL02094.1 4Fe-4S ferredoxin iron-sulfur binding domain protein [Desulfatibacillum aliphaticivorans]
MGKTVYEQFAEKIMIPGSGIVPQLIAMMTTEQEAEMLLSMPATAQELADKFSMDLSDVEDKMVDFFKKGLVFKSYKPQGIVYRMPREVMQFHDATILWHGATREYHDLWQKFMEEEWPEYTKMVEKFMPRPFSRIIPVEQSLNPKSQILAYESCKDLIDDSEDIAVTKCTCRVIAHKCDSPVEVCLQLGKSARYALERETGRKVSKQEALDIIKQSEEAGLIHVTMNRAENMHFICNCCGCCCMAMPMMVEYGRAMNDPSRFCAVIDEDACEECELCLERCVFKAIEMDEGIGAAVVNADKCMGCGVCQVTCPADAIVLDEVREKEFIPMT